ncbi:MAG TPA: leishmanolysin-related zinc metalloendopeptidase [Gemmatimonadaceae bacterium]|nr:leishmanolysin-related zinc metalloendopeptidase [Gemmatimonadaceae bacterium]
MRIPAAILLAVLVAACSDSTAPPPPASIAPSVGALSGTAGLPLPTAPSFSVKDANGTILGGVPITIAVTGGGGTLVNAPTSTVAGVPTPVGTWTLGKVAGTNTLTVTVADLPPLVITINSVAGPAASLVAVSGDRQSGFAGAELPAPLSFQVHDQFGNGVPSTIVSFVVTGGGGTISPGSVVTDAAGMAGAAVWRLGKTAVPQTAIVSAGGLFTTLTSSVSTNFNVDVRFFGPTPSDEAASAFIEAGARIRATIVGDIPDVDIPLLRSGAGIDIGPCGVSGVIVNEVVDDVLIYASVAPIDGSGKVLASARVCVIRNQSRLATIGVMKFDVEDVNGLISTGRLSNIVLHEMLHVVGFGTIWADSRRPGGVLLSGGGTDNPRYTGPLAISACGVAGGTGACGGGVAVEGLPFTAGTADSHWRESIFESEVMTGFVEAEGIPMPFSAITVQSLADAGYSINPSAGDQYLVPFSAALSAPGNQSRSASPADNGPWEIIGRPLFEIGPAGLQGYVGTR